MTAAELEAQGVPAVEAAVKAAKAAAPALRLIVIAYAPGVPCVQMLAAGGSEVEVLHVLQHAAEDVAENAAAINAARVAAVTRGERCH